MKRCCACKLQLPHDAFYPARNRRDGLQTICRVCNQKRYQNNKQYFYRINKENRARLKIVVDEIRSTTPCTDCGIQYEPFCMDFDHTGPKLRAVAHMVHDTFSLKHILQEIAKTEIVCVLCHKTRTYERFWNRGQPNAAQLRNRAILLSEKNKPCAECGSSRLPWQMEFDHIDPDNKRQSISLMAVTCYSEKALRAEIIKCRVVCTLCHRRKSVAQMRETSSGLI